MGAKMMISLLHGDCIELMKTIPDASVDMCLTDPPYGTTACKWDSVIPFAPMWEQLHRIVKPNGAICLFGSEPFSSALRMSNIKRFKYDWIWHKNSATGGILAKFRPMKAHEVISVFSYETTPYYPQETPRFDQSGRYKYKVQSGRSPNHYPGIKKIPPKQYDADFVSPRSVLEIKIPHNSCNRVHPTQKPVALLEYLIKTYTLEGEIVLDFTMGSGSTGVACVNLKRKFIGIERDDHYFDIAKKRINEVMT